MRLVVEDSVVLTVDYQEKILPAVQNREKLIQRTVRLLNGAKAMQLPVIVSEQYPKGLGRTIDEIKDAAGEDAQLIEKMTFSCCDNDEFIKALESTGKKTVIVCGIEAHVCVLQTVIDLIAKGYTVALVKDCVSSRFPDDLEVAFDRAKQEGAIMVSSESVLFELTRRAGNDIFKTVSKLVK